jgi:hypothetical protein
MSTFKTDHDLIFGESLLLRKLILGIQAQVRGKKAIYVLLNGFYHQSDRIAEQFFQFI